MDIFDLEQEIMKCWNVVDDLKDCIHYLDSWPNEDKRDNLLLGMAALYQMRFERLWECFEDSAGEYHRMRRSLDDNAKRTL
jgi:hypothetical protein